MTKSGFAGGPVAPGLVQLDRRTLVSVRVARSTQEPVHFRAVALAILRDSHRVALSSTTTAGFGPDPASALDACLARVRDNIGRRRLRPHRPGRRPEASL